MKMIKWVLLTALFSLPALGQSNGVYNATTYAYTTQVTKGNSATGASSIGANPTAFAQGIPFLPYNVNAPITINRNAATAETITPSAIASCFPNSLTCTLSGTFTFKHISGESVQSGTFGLQEAINIAVVAGSGTVLIDASWQGPAGTSLILAAKGTSSVMIQDNRNPSGATFYQWNGSAYAATGTGGAVSSVYGRTGAVTANTGDYTCAQVTGCPTAPILSINGDTTQAQHMAASGTGLSVATVAGVTTYTLAGGGLTGTITSSALGQMTGFPTAGTNVAGIPNLYTINTGWSQSQINTLTSGLSGANTIFIPAGAPQIGYTNNGQVPHDFRLGADWFQMPGIACDGRQTANNITVTSGTNTTFGGSLFTSADVGKTFFFYNRSGFAFGSTQSVWTPTMTGFSFPTATWSSNAPFTATGQFSYGTDNLTSVTAAMTQAGLVFPLTIPTGCAILVNGTISWNNSQVIVGRHLQQGGFIGRPGADVIATPDTSGQGVSTGGTGFKGFFIQNATEIDWTLGYNLYSANGTLTVVPPVYRPLYDHTSIAPNPLGPGWLTGGKNGVAAIAQNSAVICTPNTYTPPAVGSHIMFPYFASIFSTTVSSIAGSCSGGSTARTLAAAFPNTSTYNVTQAEWFTGSAIQSTTTTIPTSIIYPLTLALTLSTDPKPGWVSNFPQHGTIKVCGIEAEYMGITSSSLIIRRGPATSAGCTGTTPIAVMNMCQAKNMLGPGGVDQPWPVTATINSGDSTPSGANWFPGECGGNAAIAFPTANANTYVGSGLVGGFLSDINFIGTAGAGSGNANNAAGVYIAGNNAPFGSHFENLIASNLQYDFAQGPASSGQHGVAAVGPTGFGNTIHNIWFFGAFPLAFVDFQGSDVSGINMNSTEISPFDGTAVGSATCLQVGFTLDEQTGGIITSSSFDIFHPYGCENEGGSHIEVNSAVDIQGSNISFDAANFEGIPNVFGGDHLKLTNSSLALPTIDYGTNNDFGIVDGSNAGYITNTWSNATPQFLGWGVNGKCSAFAGGIGPAVACGAAVVQGYEGRSIEPSVTGTKIPYFAMGGMITPWMWNNSLDGMTSSGAPDTTAPYWGASATCALGGSAQCSIIHFNGFNGLLYIGQFNQLYPGPYMLDATFKTLTAASSFELTINAEDSGTGQCSSGFSQLFNGTINTTTSFTPITPVLVDMTGHQGCVLQVIFQVGSTTDTVVIDRFNFVPYPGYVRGPLVAPTYPGTCPAGTPSGAWLGAFSGFTYFCDGTTVHRVGIS